MISRSTYLRLLVGDAACLYFTFFWVTVLRRLGAVNQEFLIEHLVFYSLVVPLWLWVFNLCGLYEPRFFKRLPRATLGVAVFAASALSAFVIYFISGIFDMPTPKTVLVLSAALAWVLLVYWRGKAQAWASGLAQDLAPSCLVIEKEQLSVMNPACDESLKAAAFDGVPIYVDSTFISEESGKAPLERIGPQWVIERVLGRHQTQIGYHIAKRIMDISFCLLMFIPALIFGVLAAVWVKLVLGGGVIYSQSRVGYRGKIFTLWKFRTMRDETLSTDTARAQLAVHGQDSSGRVAVLETVTVKSDQRVARGLRLLRRLHLDELPQIYNVLRGEMSWVGPRPEQVLITRELESNIPFYWTRSLAVPGITGWAQINQGYVESFADARDRFAYDLYYLANRNAYLDAAILVRTLRTLVAADGR
ncbi:MAG: sugar transferase [Elusimicrobiota bacterium]